MPEGLEGGVVVHDGFKPYRKLDGLAHPARLSPMRSATPIICANSRRSSSSTRSPGRRACAIVSATPARRSRKPARTGKTALSPAALEAFHTRYWEALREGLAWHRNLPRLEKAGPKSGRTKRRTGDNLLLRLHRFKDDVLRFLVDFDVPFTNNLAEQALRMMKVKMKISGGFRTPEGAHAFAALRSVIATARKQGRNILLSLAAEPKTLATLINP